MPEVRNFNASAPTAVLFVPLVKSLNAVNPTPTLRVAPDIKVPALPINKLLSPKSSVSVFPDPENWTVVLAVTILIFPATGVTGPPVLPVIVVTPPDEDEELETKN